MRATDLLIHGPVGASFAEQREKLGGDTPRRSFGVTFSLCEDLRVPDESCRRA